VELAGKYGARVHGSIEELVADPQVEIVHIASIPSLHASHAMAALRAGKHVLSEKPLATTLADGQQVVSMCQRRQVCCSVNFMMRYGPLWEPVKKLVDRQILGEPLRAEVVNCAGDSGLPADHWFWDDGLSGGIFIEHGVHFFDLISSWLGNGRVTAAGTVRRPDTKIVDQAFCQVRYGRRASGSFYHGFHQADALDRQEVRLIFERGEIVLRGWIQSEFHLQACVDAAVRAQLSEILREVDAAAAAEVQEKSGGILCCSWSSPLDRQALYGQAVRDLMVDLIGSIHSPAGPPRVTAGDGLAALAQAVEARKLSFHDKSDEEATPLWTDWLRRIWSVLPRAIPRAS
jgi:predicted dehydrogenase